MFHNLLYFKSLKKKTHSHTGAGEKMKHILFVSNGEFIKSTLADIFLSRMFDTWNATCTVYFKETKKCPGFRVTI